MENDGGEEETPRPQNLYTIFLVILVFFVTGLMGILLCHVLQEKGYRCRTSRELEPEASSAAAAQDGHDSNQDTVGQIVQCILDNKANAEALKEMLKEHEQMKPPAHSPFFPEKIAQPPLAESPHHHTVHSDAVGENRSVCLHCSQRRIHADHRLQGAKGHAPRVEVTVFSVGRFRVTHIERSRAGEELSTFPVEEVCVQACTGETERDPERGSGELQGVRASLSAIHQEQGMMPAAKPHTAASKPRMAPAACFDGAHLNWSRSLGPAPEDPLRCPTRTDRG